MKTIHISVCFQVALCLVFASFVLAGDCSVCDEAQELYEAGDYKAVVSTLKKATKKGESTPELNILLVKSYFQLDLRKKATKAIDALLEEPVGHDQMISLQSFLRTKEATAYEVDIKYSIPPGAEPPILLLFNRPAPSGEAKYANASGDVVIDGVVKIDGSLTKLEERRIGDWSRQSTFRFGESAIFAMQGWKFFPALIDGKPVEALVTAVVRVRP